MSNTYDPNTMQTYTGIYLNPTNPTIEQLNLEDMAHALSLMCRCAGHAKHFYSVAHHSINVWYMVREKGGTIRQQLLGVTHDLSEGLGLVDLPSPLKRQLPEYLMIEKKVQNMIYEKVGLGDITSQEYALVKECDLEMLYNESKIIMKDISWIPNYDTYEFKYTDLVTKQSYNHEEMRDTLLEIINTLMKQLKKETRI